MAAEVFLSYYLYYASGLLLSLLTRSVIKPVFVILVVFHWLIYGVILSADGSGHRTASAEYRYWIPMTTMMGILSGYAVAQLLNFRRLIFFRRELIRDYGGWMLGVMPFQLFMLIATLCIWELEGVLVKPFSYVTALACQAVFIPIAGWAWHGHIVFAYEEEGSEALKWDDYAGHIFYGVLWIYLCLTTLVFGLIRWLAPSFWPFWIGLMMFGLHATLTSMAGACIRPGAESEQDVYGTRSGVLKAIGVPLDAYSPSDRERSAEMGLLSKREK